MEQEPLLIRFKCDLCGFIGEACALDGLEGDTVECLQCGSRVRVEDENN